MSVLILYVSLIDLEVFIIRRLENLVGCSGKQCEIVNRMESLVGYGSDDENDERYYQEGRGGGGGVSGGTRRCDDTNYDDVTMDMSEDSNNNESDRELPQAEPAPMQCRRRLSPAHSSGKESRRSESPRRERDRRRDDKRGGRERDRERGHDKRSERDQRGGSASSGGRRGLLGDRPSSDVSKQMPALMDLKPFGGEHPPPLITSRRSSSKDERDSRVSRDRDRDRDKDRDRNKDRDRERDSHRDKDRHRRSPDRKRRRSRSRSRSGRSSREPERGRGDKSRDRAHVPPDNVAPFPSRGDSRNMERVASAAPEYRPSSYKVSKKLQVMEKMGLQIKTPDGSMATAQQLMQRSATEQRCGAPGDLPAYYNPGAVNLTRISSQLQKRKLLWGSKASSADKPEPEQVVVPAAAAKWSGTKFAQDQDGKVASKFLRLMGIKDPNAVPPPPPDSDVNEKQEEMFQAMQAQYDVARATTHTMRGQGLGFQRNY